MLKILSLCTDNSCRSQMANGFLKSFDKNIEFYSAGTEPANQVHPVAIQVMQEVCIDISENRTKLVNKFPDKSFDFVITVCGEANKSCPMFTREVTDRLHIGFDDPAEARETEDYILTEVGKARNEITQDLLHFFENNL